MAHGLIFIAFVVAGLCWSESPSNGRLGTWLLALLASIVPLCSVIFLIWADRTGRMGAASASAGSPATRPIDTRNDVTDLGA